MMLRKQEKLNGSGIIYLGEILSLFSYKCRVTISLKIYVKIFLFSLGEKGSVFLTLF